MAQRVGGLDGSWQTSVRPIVDEVIRARGVPGVVVAVARGSAPPEYLVVGTDGDGVPLRSDTLFPVASITKLATALAVLRLVAEGRLSLDDSLASYVPDAVAAREGVTVRTLLSHTAGLPDDVDPSAAPYTLALDWPMLARACLATEPVHPPRTMMRYSNLGPGLLAIAIERVTGVQFATVVNESVFKPLSIEGYLGVQPPRSVARVTGDFVDHVGTELEPFNTPFWRSLALPWGGLITTAEGALRLVNAFAGAPSGFLPPALTAEATTDQTGALAGEMAGIFRWERSPWGLGAELRGQKSPHWTSLLASPASFGHAGLSGCLVWSDPQTDVSWFIHGVRTLENWWKDWATIDSAILSASSRS